MGPRLLYLLLGFLAGAIFARITLPEPRPRRLPQFDYEIGFIEEMDAVISGGELRDEFPPSLECPAACVIYSVEIEHVDDCTGFGPEGANNRLCDEAFNHAMNAAQQIECPNCARRIEEIWRGWSCHWSNADQRFSAAGAVELKVECYMTE